MLICNEHDTEVKEVKDVTFIRVHPVQSMTNSFDRTLYPKRKNVTWKVFGQFGIGKKV